jgi:hypothetical protein
MHGNALLNLPIVNDVVVVRLSTRAFHQSNLQASWYAYICPLVSLHCGLHQLLVCMMLCWLSILFVTTTIRYGGASMYGNY